MAKKKKEEPKVDNEVGSLKVKEKVEKQPDGNETKGNVTKVKAKMKMKPMDMDKETITKVDLSKPPKTEKDAVQEQSADEVSIQDQPAVSEEVVEEIIETTNEEPAGESNAVQDETAPIVEEITNEEKAEEIATVAEEAITESIEQGTDLPENVQKLVDFMEETGGDIQDYVKLNQDYSEMDNDTLLTNFYKQTRPHLDDEEIEFLMEDQFSFDSDVDEDKDIKRKKLALKEQVAQAKQHLESVKSKYYEDIKSGSKLSKEQQEAIDFFNKHKEESEQNYELLKKQASIFENKTKKIFHEDFKGFEYSVGDKKFRFNIKDPVKLKETQGDINNFIRKFLTKDNTMDDAAGYHKGLFTAMNPDRIANHFYEQGKADALKNSVTTSKNVDMTPRQGHQEVSTGGFKYKVVGDDSSKLRFKIKK